MMPQIYKEIDNAVASGTPLETIAPSLISQGYPESLVQEAVKAYMLAHGRSQLQTSFNIWLKAYRRRALPAVITLVIIGVFSSSVMLLQPWPTKILVDSVFGSTPAPGPLAPYTHQPVLILFTSLMTIGVFLLSVFFETIRDFTVLKLGFWLNRGIKEDNFRHILNLPLYHPERLPKGDYIYRQNILTDSLSDLVLDTTASIAQSVIMVLGVLSIMLVFNPSLTMISVFLVPFLYLLVRVFGPKLGKISRQITVVNSDTSTAIAESIDNTETIQAFNTQEKQVGFANQLWYRGYYLSRRALFWGRSYRFSNSLLIIIGTSLVMYFGGTAALEGKMILGQLLIFMVYMGFLLKPIENIAVLIATRNQKKVDVSRVHEVLTDHEGVETLRDGKIFPFTGGRIEFQNVSYTYRNLLVLNNINLVVEPGQKIGIIGPSGGGKSSFLKMIPLFMEPSSGRVLIDGVDIQTVSLKQLRDHIVWISQSPQLFNKSILENLRDGNPRQNLEQPAIEQAIIAANVKEFTDRLPRGLDSLVGESGNLLSGGQKQRIAIARGLIKNAPIVCMDEPTAALDSKSENTIRDSISKLIAGKTVLMITHRKALLSLMDKVYVMDNGELHHVDSHGGLDAYLRKISDTESSRDNRREAALQAEALQKMSRLEAEKHQLQEELRQASENIIAQNNSSDGTIIISH